MTTQTTPLANDTAFHLLALLSQNALADFHTMLESLRDDALAVPNVRRVIEMEQFFIEGRYKKVLESVQHLDIPNAETVIPVLKETMRGAIADTIQAAYTSLPVAYTVQSLMLDDYTQLSRIAQEVCLFT